MKELVIVKGGYEIKIERMDINEIDLHILEAMLEEIDKEKKPCVEYETVTGVTYELCRDMLMPNKFTLNIYYKI